VIPKHRAALPIAVMACASALLVSNLAIADGEPEPKPERRYGFVLGVVSGLSLGNVVGNPTAQAERYDSAHTTDTGVAVGYRVTPYLGGALTDWFTFGLGGSYSQLYASSTRSSLGVFLFRIEAYPLYSKGGIWRDLGVNLDFGAGATSIKNKSDGAQLAYSGVASTVGLGVFWETWRLGPIALGPSVGYQHNWSDWYARNDLTLGLKATFYGGP
jgi:hypothetical protein